MFDITELTCRVCLHEQEELINIYEELEDLNTNLSELLEACADLQIKENDTFPKYLCEECTRELLITSRFREKCWKSKQILEEMLENTYLTENESSYLSDIIEYCAEDTTDIEIDDLIIHDPVTPNEQNSEKITEKINYVEDDMELSNNKVLKQTEFLYQAGFDSYAEESTVSEDYSDQTLFTTEISPEPDEEYKDKEVSVIKDISMIAISTKSSEICTIRVFICDVCGAKFKHAINLQKHLQKSHDSVNCFICSKCRHCFTMEKKFIKHVEDCNYNETAISEIVESKKSKKVKIVSTTKAEEIGRKCLYCTRDFPTPFALRMHLRTHTGERPFQCKYCSKSFKTQSQLNVHHKRHIGQADFICNICNKSFYEQSNLTVHIRSHTGERPHVCTVCNKTFTRVFLLQFHMRTHTGEKPFKCNYCERNFRQHTDLLSHITIHTGEKKHTCILCEKSYIKRSHLVEHIRKHHNNVNNEDIVAADSLNEQSTTEINLAADESQICEDNAKIYNFNEVLEMDGVITLNAM